MFFGKNKKSIQLTDDELFFVQESIRLLGGRSMRAPDQKVLSTLNSMNSSLSDLSSVISLTGGTLTSKKRSVINDIKNVVSFAVDNFEENLRRTRDVIDIQSISGNVQSPLLDKQKRLQGTIDVGRSVLEKLAKLE